VELSQAAQQGAADPLAGRDDQLEFMKQLPILAKLGSARILKQEPKELTRKEY
jgi:hypothetical protein